MIKARPLKTLTKILLTGTLCCTLALPLWASGAVGLKKNATVSDNTIKLGDVFYGLSGDEDRVLGASPMPGQDMTLNARTLLRIAMALDLPWRPAHSNEFITIRRQATIIEQTQIEEAIKTALHDNGSTYGDFAVILPQDIGTIILPHDQLPEMEVTDIKFDSAKQTFIASIAAPSAANPIQNLQVKGKIEPVIAVPVLRGNIQNGHIISENDIEMISLTEKDLSRDIVTDAQKIIGMTARRMISGGRPVRETDMIAPQIVARGELVTLSMNSGILSLTTEAKALENGAKGDIIRVVNTSSNITVQAIVIGEKQVQISDSGS